MPRTLPQQKAAPDGETDSLAPLPCASVTLESPHRVIGFDVDEPLDALGCELMLPPQYEAEALDTGLTPIVNPRQAT